MEPAQADRSCWSPPARWSTPTAACCWRSGRKASRWPACGSFPAARSSPARRRRRRLIRELREEIGIETKIACLAPLTFASHSYETFHLLMPLFVCRRFWGTPEPREGQTLKWVRPRQMRDYPMPPADAPLIPFLIDLL